MNNKITAMLPWSREAEQAALGSLLVNCHVAYDLAQPLEPIHFFSPSNATIYRAIRSLMAKHLPVDTVTVFEHLRDTGQAEDAGGLQYLHELSQGVGSHYNVARYAAIVREKAMCRALLETADKAVELASEATGDAAAKLDQITSMFGALQRQQITKVPRSLSEIAVERTAHYDALESGTIEPGWKTHIPQLDALLNGGLRPGGLYIIAARPSVGKSSFSQALGMGQAMDGRKVLFLSQEMGCEELADRAVSNVGRINYSALLSGRMQQDDWSRAVKVTESASLKDFFVDDQAGLTLMDIRGKAKQVKGLGVLIVDYLQLCSGSGGKEVNRNSEIEVISRGLKTLAKELGIAVIALSQLNRQVEQRTSKRPMLSDLRDSGSIEQDADVVAFLWPVREFVSGSRLIGLGIDKNRQGKLGDVALHFDGSVQRWTESSESLYQQDKPRSSGYMSMLTDKD